MKELKVEINLTEALSNTEEYGSLTDAIRAQAIEKASDQLVEQLKVGALDGLQKKIDAALGARIDALMEEIFTQEYQVRTKWGQPQETTTLKAQIFKTLEGLMVYEKQAWDRDKNAFTKAIDSLVHTHVNQFSKEFNRVVDSKFVAEAMAYAEKTLRERMKVSA